MRKNPENRDGQRIRSRVFSKKIIDPTEFQKRLPSREEEIESERRAFWNLLVSVIAKVDFQLSNNNQTEILDIACGKCIEASVLNSFFGGMNYGQFSEQIKITGIDIRDGMIEEAKSLYQSGPYRFLTGDATQLSRYNLPASPDVIVIRHQEMVNGASLWEQIISQAIDRLKESGIAIITSYTQEENQLLLNYLDRFELPVKLTVMNQFAKETRIPGVAIDRYVVIIQK